MLVRTWNLFHGNTVPPGREAFLDEMVELATADDPDVLCVQEVPAWALSRFTASALAQRPMLGPLPIPALLGRLLTSPNHGLLRSAFAGQGNAIAVSPRHRVVSRAELALNPASFRRREAKRLGLGPVQRLAWAKERRIVHAVRLETGVLVANAHCTSYPADRRLAEAELLRAAWFAVSEARTDDTVVLAGDFNVTAEQSETLRSLTGPEWGFSQPGPGIDHVLVRGAAAPPPRVWTAARRRHDGRLLSDHAPVEVEFA